MTGRITLVIGSLDYGGAERHLVQVLPALAKRGWVVEVFTLSTPGAQAPILETAGIAVHGTPLRGTPPNLLYRLARLVAATWSFWLHLRRAQPAITHFFLPQAYLLGGLVSLLVDARRVMSRRSRNFYQRKRPLIARLERFLHACMDAVIANSRPVARDLEEEGVPPQRLGLIYNGIDLQPFSRKADRSALRREWGVGDDALLFVMVANLIPYKGHRDLLVALSRARLPRWWRLVCVGRDDGILHELQALASELALADRVLWTGARTDIPDLLGAADVGVLSSHEEGFSNAVLEYMAAGLPTIVTDVGGNAEAILDGVTGLIVPSRDQPALTAALERLADPLLRMNMGAAGRRRVETEFSLERCVDDYEELYRTLLANRRLSPQLRADRNMGG